MLVKPVVLLRPHHVWINIDIPDWLIGATLELKSYIDVNVCPKYAVLSHRWTDDEVTHKDFIKGRRKNSAGYKKILDFCTAAKRDNFGWAWADTCCIDKRSSAELQEAINSMFRYYQASRKCYVHLADVSATLDDAVCKTEFQNSQWFTRAWTLQELLAPSRIEFYSSTWEVLGRIGRYAVPFGKMSWFDNSPEFRDLISEASGVRQDCFAGKYSVFDFSVACRMSWAAKRVTTRSEDIAYCLLGLFQVNMPLLYGEGERKAFMRLQEEIMKLSDDHSLFAWTATDNTRHPSLRCASFCHGLLADSPSVFAQARNISPSLPRRWSNMDAYTLTSRGVKILLPVLHVADDIFVAKLDCKAGSGANVPIIILRKVSSIEPVYQRIFCGDPIMAHDKYIRAHTDRWKIGTISVRQTKDLYHLYWGRPTQFFLLDPSESGPYHLRKVSYTHSGDAQDHVTITQRAKSTSGQDGILLQSLVGSRSTATLSIQHLPNSESLVIEIVALSKYFFGFRLYLPGVYQFKPSQSISSASLDIGQPNDILKALSGEPLVGYSAAHRLGSTISVPSTQDKDRCHVVTLGIKTIHVYDHMKIYTLDLDIKYESIPDGHRSDGCRVISPTGLNAEIIEYPPHSRMPWAMMD